MLTLQGPQLEAMLKQDFSQVLDIPTLMRNTEKQPFLINMNRSDDPQRLQMITQLTNLPPKELDSVLAALSKNGSTAIFDMVYCSYAKIVPGTQSVNLIDKSQKSNFMRNLQEGKLDKDKFFFWTEARLSFGLAETDEDPNVDTGLVADFDAILYDNAAAGTPSLYRTNVPPQIKNGQLKVQINKDVDYDDMSMGVFFQDPYGDNAGRFRWKSGKWILPQLQTTITLNLSAPYTPPVGFDAYVKIILIGGEIRIA